MLIYKIDVLDTLKQAGYNTTRLRKEKILGENIIQYLREEKPVSAKTLDILCGLLRLQPSDIFLYMDEKEYTKNNVKTLDDTQEMVYNNIIKNKEGDMLDMNEAELRKNAIEKYANLQRIKKYGEEELEYQEKLILVELQSMGISTEELKLI